MPEPKERKGEDRFSLLADSRRALSDLGEMISLRQQLAETELRSDIATTRRFAIWGGTAVTLMVVGISVLAVIVGGQLDRQLALWLAVEDVFPWASLLMGVALGVSGLLLLWLAWRRFRRELVVLEDSIAELKEDLMWMREFSQRDDRH